MTDGRLEQDYERVLDASRRKGEVHDEPPGSERRRHPRIRVNPGSLPAELDPWVFAIDVSISGMAFYADEPVEAGATVNIHLDEQVHAEVDVLACDAEQSDQPYLPVRYRLHCRFADEEAGKRLLVAIKDLEGTGSAG